MYRVSEIEKGYSLVSHVKIRVLVQRSDLRRTDWTACEALLSSLQPDSSTDPELSFLLSESRIYYFIARGMFSEAFKSLEALSTSLKEEGADVMQRVEVLIAKAEIYRQVGEPERGFSVALRAASVAFKARLMPCLWTAVGLLANILNSISEFGAAMRLLHAVIPQVSAFLDLSWKSANPSVAREL